MARKSETDLARADMIQTIRTVRRLQHNIALRHELNELEDAATIEFEKAIQRGEPYQLDVRSVLDELQG